MSRAGGRGAGAALACALLLAQRAECGLDLLAVPDLEPTLRCSACEVTVREIHSRMDKAHPDEMVQTGHRLDKARKVNYKKSELFATEILDTACDGIQRKYKLAQENWGGHFKVFCAETDPVDLSMCEKPDWYDPEDETNRYAGASVRLLHRCKEIIGEREEELIERIRKDEQLSVMRKEVCDKDCSGPAIDDFKDEERAARRAWRRRTGRKKGKRKAADAVPISGPGQTARIPDPNEPGLKGEIDSRASFHADTRLRREREAQEEERQKRAEKREEIRKRREEIEQGERERRERDAQRKQETRGLTFKEWQAQQGGGGGGQDDADAKRAAAWEERQRRKQEKRQQREQARAASPQDEL